jgi:hypothetical protein
MIGKTGLIAFHALVSMALMANGQNATDCTTITEIACETEGFGKL